MQAPTQHPTPTNTPPTPPPRWRRLWAFAAAFILILVVVGSAVLLLRSDDARVSDEPAPPVTVAKTPTEAIVVESLVWSRLPLDEDVVGVPVHTDMARADSGFEIVSVTSGGPGLVAVGHSICKGTSTCTANAVVWTSPDGINWARLPVLREPGLQAMKSVTAGGPGLVAVGTAIWEPPEVYDGPKTPVWTSVDGIVWSRVPHDPSLGRFYSVTVGGPGLVAVGEDSRGAAVWTSSDGIRWTRVPHDADVFGDGAMLDVVNVGTRLVAIGALNGQRAMWTSSDGINWSVFPIRPNINAITVGGPGFVAVGVRDKPRGACGPGEAGDCHAVVWTSPDGVTWTKVPHDEAVFGGPDDKQVMNAITTVGSDLVAVGTSVWISPDGISWSRVQDPGVSTDLEMRSVVVGGPGLVAIGEVDGLPAIWTATPEG